MAGLRQWQTPHSVHCVCLDLSVSGAQLSLPEPLQPGEELLITFTFETEAIECAARVLRNVEAPNRLRWRIGCEFQGISDAALARLSEYVLGQWRTRI